MQTCNNQKLNLSLDNLYLTLNKKNWTFYTNSTNNRTNKEQQHTQTVLHIINLSSVNFSNEEIKIMKLGTRYSFKKEPKFFVKELIPDTGNVIRHLDAEIHNAYRILALKKIKEIVDSNKTNSQHKRYQHVIKQIRNKLTQNFLMVVKADKGRLIVIINTEQYKQ